MNNDTFLIEHNYIEDAQSLCGYIEDSVNRSKAVANNLAANISAKYFSEIDVDTESGLHNISYVLNDIEISDIYIKNNYIDVRFYFDSNNILVPKSHFDYELQPVAYMFIKLDEDLSSGSVTGFIFPKNIDITNELNGYYKVNESDFVSYYDMESRLLTNEEDDLPDNIESVLFEYLDGRLNNSEKKRFYQLLIKSKGLRCMLADAEKAKNIFNFVHFDNQSMESSNYENNELINDSVDEIAELDLNVEPVALNEVSEGYDLLENNSGEELVLEETVSDSIVELDNNEETILTNDDTVQIVADDNISDINEQQIQDDALDLEVSEQEDSLQYMDSDVEETQSVEVADYYEDTTSVSDSTDDNENASNMENTDVSYENSQPADDFEELEKYNYETSATPSMADIIIESDSQTEEITEDMLGDENDSDEHFENNADSSYNNSNQQIDELFNDDYPKVVNTSKKKSSILPLISVLAILGTAGYFGYTKYFQPSTLPNNVPNNLNMEAETSKVQKSAENNDIAMPVETVDNVDQLGGSVENDSSSIPAIEQSLDATIDVSNLSINWEVPASYTSNSTAKRYFVRIGKILQLNLKTEMLLLSSSPITNKISLELEFDKNISKFKVKTIINSSGILKIDNVVKETTEKALNMNLNTNMSVFNTLQGNPTLVIKL